MYVAFKSLGCRHISCDYFSFSNLYQGVWLYQGIGLCIKRLVFDCIRRLFFLLYHYQDGLDCINLSRGWSFTVSRGLVDCIRGLVFVSRGWSLTVTGGWSLLSGGWSFPGGLVFVGLCIRGLVFPCIRGLVFVSGAGLCIRGLVFVIRGLVFPCIRGLVFVSGDWSLAVSGGWS